MSTTLPQTREERAAAIESGLSLCTGSETIYRWWAGIKFTDGIKYMATACEAFWLLDVIASHQARPKVRRNQRLQEFQLWRIVVNHDDSTAVVTCHEDSDEPAVVRQRIPFTDFPLDQFECYVENNVILLKSEH